MTSGKSMLGQSLRYPILSALPPAEAAAIEAQSDCGIPLTDDQAARLGIRTGNVILLPVDGRLTPEQIRSAFPHAESTLSDLVKLCAQKEKSYGR